MSGPSRVVVLRPNAVGDFIFSLPCLHALKQSWPDCHITYIGRQWHADFLAARPGPVDEVLVLPPCPGIGLPPDAEVDQSRLDDFLYRLQAREVDLALQIYGGGRHANPFVRRFKARLCAGFRAPEAEPLDRWVHYGPLQNRRLQMLEVATLVGAQGCGLNGPELQVTEEDRRQASAVLGDLAGQKLAVIQPGASDARRRWPAQRFAFIADWLAAQGYLIAVNGTEAEADVVREVIGHMRKPALDLTARLSLSGLCGLLSRAQLLVSNDTGPLHLALALGTPSVGIYWLYNLVESGPLQQALHRPLMSVRIHCPRCGMENLKERCPHDVCFVDDVGQEAVLAEVQSLLQPA